MRRVIWICTIIYMNYISYTYLWTAVYIQQQSPTIRYRFTFLLITRLEWKCQRSNSAPAYIQITPCCSFQRLAWFHRTKGIIECIFPRVDAEWTDARHSFAYNPWEEGVMTVKGGYYFSLPWLREAFETLDDLATLPAIYYTRIHAYTRVSKA